MKNVIITGVSRGLGESLFETLKKEHVNLIAIGRHFTERQEKSGKLLIQHDFCLQEEGYLVQLCDGLVDDDMVIINNAGIVDPIGNIGEIRMLSLAKAMQVNFLGPAELINYLVSHCKTMNRKMIVINISTGAAKNPIAGWVGYCTTKASMRMFLDVLATQEKESGVVQVCHVDPGVMNTGMQAKIRTAKFPRMTEFVEYYKKGKLRDPMFVAQEIVKKYLKL